MQYKEIQLHSKVANGRVAIVDEADFDLVCRRKWYYNGGYAIAGGPSVRMHRLIMGCEDPGLVVDHIDGNRLDNRRANLRIVTPQENKANRRIPLERTEHDGIHWDRFSLVWIVVLYKDGYRFRIGRYKTIDAAIAVRDAELRHGGFNLHCERPVWPCWVARSAAMILADDLPADPA